MKSNCEIVMVSLCVVALNFAVFSKIRIFHFQIMVVPYFPQRFFPRHVFFDYLMCLCYFEELIKWTFPEINGTPSEEDMII